MFDNMRRLHPRGVANRGLCVDAEGAMLGPACVLVSRMRSGFRAIDRDEAAAVQRLMFGGGRDHDWLFQQCQRIAGALDKGELALAQIYGLRIPIGDLDDEQVRRIAGISLAKAGFNPNERRIPKGERHGGEWTTSGNQNSEPAGLLTDTAYQGVYHDLVVAQIAAQWRAKGAKVITEVKLIARDGTGARADIVAIAAGDQPPFLIEVKTGNDPRYTPRQINVYPMAQIGDHVFSPDPKIMQLGFLPGQWLPPMEFFTIYKRDPKSDYMWTYHMKPIFP